MVSYIAAFLTAASNAASNVLNRKATRDQPAQHHFRARLILGLLRRRTWLAAVALMLVSFVLGAVAMGTGQLATAQIIIVLELPITLLGAAKFLGGRLRAVEWAAIAGLTGGVIGVLACLDPRSGTPAAAGPAAWIIGSAATAAPAVALVVAARRTGGAARRAALLGMASGLGYGLASAYAKGVTQQFAYGGITGVLASWQLYAAGAAGITAMWLLQNTYHAGRLAAGQPGITLLGPSTAAVWGVVVFGEHVRGGVFLASAALPAVILIASVLVLSRSAAMQATAGAEEGTREPAQRRAPRRGQIRAPARHTPSTSGTPGRYAG